MWIFTSQFVSNSTKYYSFAITDIHALAVFYVFLRIDNSAISGQNYQFHRDIYGPEKEVEHTLEGGWGYI
jgi:hypothetical protein